MLHSCDSQFFSFSKRGKTHFGKMAENSTLEYMNELHEYSEENEEVSVVVFSNENGEYSDVNDSDDQLDLEGILSIILFPYSWLSKIEEGISFFFFQFSIEIYLEEDEEGEQIEDETTATTQLKCDICDREFNTIVERNQHIEEHFKQIECPVCSRIFVGHSAFEFHTSKGKCKRATTKLQLFRCSLCNEKIFDSAKLLEKHIRDKHKCSINQNSISCEKCNRAFGKFAVSNIFNKCLIFKINVVNNFGNL